MASRTDSIIRTFPSQLASIRSEYEGNLTAKAMSDGLLHSIARLIEDFQRVFDWTATDIDQTHGEQRDRSPYFPLQADPVRFAQAIARDFPRVPNVIVAALERHQPYQDGKGDLAHLHDLTRVNKHQDFTPQTRTTTREVSVTDPRGGSIAYNDQVTFGPGGVSLGPGGSLTIGPGGSIDIGPGGVFAQGVPIDPRTQRPVPTTTHRVSETIYVGWNFVTPDVPVLATLQSLANLTTDALADVRQAAGL